MKKNTQNKAFTLIELLVVISIISLLASILLPKLQQARAKADDVRRKAVLKNIQSQIIGDKADATTNFSDIFSSGSKAKDMLDTLISQTGVSSTDYDAKVSSDGTSYAVVFPLKADPTKYWCVDSTGVSKEVGGRLTGNSVGCLSAGVANPPDFSPSFTINPSIVASPGQVQALVTIAELKNADSMTGQDVVVSIPTYYFITGMTFNPTLTSALGSPVENNAWEYLGVSNNKYLWKYIGNNGVFPHNYVSRFSFTMSIFSSNEGTQILDVRVQDFSGGEVNISNNSDSESLYNVINS